MEFKEDLDKLAEKMADIGQQIKDLSQSQDEIKEEILETNSTHIHTFHVERFVTKNIF